MSRFTLVLLLSVTVLAVLANSNPAFAQKAAPVVVTNTSANPVPVTGSVNAAVSGTVSVGTMPNVTVSSMPAVTLGSGATVAIDPATTVNAADVAARNIVRLRATLDGEFSGFAQVNPCQIAPCVAIYYVPAGKRLMITNISGVLLGPTGILAGVLAILTNNDDTKTFLEPHKLPFTSISAHDTYIFNSTQPEYADAGSYIEVVPDSSSPLESSLTVFFQGYLVDCGAGCILNQQQ